MKLLMHEEDLGKVMPGVKPTPPEREDAAPSATAHTRDGRLKSECDKSHGRLFTRFLMATIDSSEGFSSVDAQVIQIFAPIGTAGFGDRHGAVQALEAQYCLNDISQMKNLHDKLRYLGVTGAEGYNPSCVIQDNQSSYLRRARLTRKYGGTR